MRFLLLASGLASAARAMLVLPDTDFLAALPPAVLLRSLALPCPSCPALSVPGGNADTPAQDPLLPPPTDHLLLELAVDNADTAPDRLLLNGFEVYPRPAWRGPLRAVQAAGVAAAAADPDSSIQRDLGYGLTVRPLAAATDGELLQIELHVMEVDGAPAPGVPVVVARVVRIPGSGRLLIADVQTRAAERAPEPPSITGDGRGGSRCGLFCTLRKLASGHISALPLSLPAHCSHGLGHGHVHGLGHGHGTKGYHGRPQRGWRDLLRSAARGILLPVAIGVVAGVSASVIGMLVGTFAVCVWRAVRARPTGYHRRRCCRARHAAAHAAVVVNAADAAASEKRALAAPYYDAPEEEAGAPGCT